VLNNTPLIPLKRGIRLSVGGVMLFANEAAPFELRLSNIATHENSRRIPAAAGMSGVGVNLTRQIEIARDVCDKRI